MTVLSAQVFQNTLNWSEHLTQLRANCHPRWPRLKVWSNRNCIKFPKDKCKILLIKRKPWKQYGLGRAWLGSCCAVKHLGVFTGRRLSMSQQGPDRKCGRLLSVWNEQGTANTHEAVPFHPALMRPHLEHCIQFWISQYKKYSEQVNQIQERTTTTVVVAGALVLSGKSEVAGLVHTRQWKSSKRLNGNLPIPARS